MLDKLCDARPSVGLTQDTGSPDTMTMLRKKPLAAQLLKFQLVVLQRSSRS